MCLSLCLDGYNNQLRLADFSTFVKEPAALAQRIRKEAETGGKKKAFKSLFLFFSLFSTPPPHSLYLPCLFLLLLLFFKNLFITIFLFTCGESPWHPSVIPVCKRYSSLIIRPLLPLPDFLLFLSFLKLLALDTPMPSGIATLVKTKRFSKELISWLPQNVSSFRPVVTIDKSMEGPKMRYCVLSLHSRHTSPAELTASALFLGYSFLWIAFLYFINPGTQSYSFLREWDFLLIKYSERHGLVCLMWPTVCWPARLLLQQFSEQEYRSGFSALLQDLPIAQDRKANPKGRKSQ